MDYQKIRDNDPGGTIDEALAVLEQVTESIPLTESRVSVRTVADKYGFVAAEGIRQAIEAAFPVWVQNQYLGDGLNVCSPGLTDQLKNPPFSDTQIVQVLSFQTESRLMFPGITYGDIERARADV